MPPLPNFNTDFKTSEVNTAEQQLRKLLLRGDTEIVHLTGRRVQRDTHDWEWTLVSTTFPELDTEET